MHKPAAEEEITSLHDLSAVDLIAGYRAKQFSPSEVLEEVIEHVAAWEPHIKALYLFDPEGARALGLPAVVRLGAQILAVADGTPLLLDGDAGSVQVAPPEQQLEAARERAAVAA